MGARAAILTTVAASCLAATAAAAPTAVPVQGDCNAKAITVLFWPNGHNAVRSLRFPASPRPHLEIFRYAAAKTYSNQIGLAEANGPGRIFPECRRRTPTTGVTNVPARTIKAAAAVTCSFSGSGNVQTTKVGSGWDVKLLDGKKAVLRARISATGSTLAASTLQCRIGAAPR